MEIAAGYTAEQRERARYVWGEGIVGKTMKTGSPIALPDVRVEPSFLDKTRAHGKSSGEGPLSWICVPIKIGAETLGVLSAERIGREGTRALESDTRTLTVIGCLIGQALKLHKAIERLQDEFKRQRKDFEKTIRKTYRIENIVGQSKRMQEVFAAVTSVAPSRATVLLRGESGTGKEMIARAIHQGGRPRGPPLRRRQLRRPPRDAARVGAVRPQAGRLHRRGRGAERPVRGGVRRHDLPRRGGRHPAAHAGEAAARAAGAHVRAPRREPARLRGRPDHRGDERRPRKDGARGARSGRTSTTGST